MTKRKIHPFFTLQKGKNCKDKKKKIYIVYFVTQLPITAEIK
jgi:hypothetical protein